MKFSEKELDEIQKLKTNASMIMARFFATMRMTDKPIPNVVLAGGCFTSWIANEQPKDFDIFILDTADDTTKMTINGTIDGLIISHSENKDTSKEYIKQFHDKVYRVTTLGNTKDQIIQTTYKKREELIASFDFLHTCISYTPHDNKLYLSEAVFRAAKDKILRPNRNNKAQDWRIKKFVEKGFKNEIVSV